MSALFDFARTSARDLARQLNPGTRHRLTGLPGGSKSYFLVALALERRTSMVIVCPDDIEAEGLLGDLEAWGCLLPAAERPCFLFYPEADPATRLASLGVWSQNPFALLVCSEPALAKPTLAPADLSAFSLELRPGRDYPRTKLLEVLASGGYERTDMVEMEGQVAVRGEVFDLWSPGHEKPWRLLFDGDTLESLRDFNPGTQRSEAYLEPQKLVPVKETKATALLSDYVKSDVAWWWDETSPAASPPDPLSLQGRGGDDDSTRHPSPLQGDLRVHQNFIDPAGPAKGVPREGRSRQATGGEPAGEVFYTGLPHADSLDLGFQSTAGMGGGIKRTAPEVARWKEGKGKIVFFSYNAGESDRLGELLDEQIGARGTERMEFLLGPLRAGFMKRGGGEAGLLVMTNAEIFGRYRQRGRQPKFKGGGAIKEVEDLKTGSYVVHEFYGLGRYKGLELVRAGGQEAEYLKLEYAKGDKLYVPLYDFKQVQRYSGSEGKNPRLSSLDTSAWERLKARIKESVQEVAKDLLKVHAVRAALPGYAFPPDTHLEDEFGASFLYELTPDQAKAIADVRNDMMSPRPMDRLILGDVGYGKTEVAMRAAFKAVAASKQVAVLVPTTILAEQHFRTFKERFADYPARIGMISRFQSPKEVKETLVGLANGTIDIVIGTHRLFQKDVTYHDLGLLIIDEEHRFGVKHKEQLKKWRQHLDVLTMTATPIPRTLSFALSGMRELSVIETPPTGRLPISTFVGAYDDEVVKQAIQKELDRKGQVFYVHNRVQSLPMRLKFIKDLLPNVSIGVVHGQMSGDDIEKVMWEFLHRKHEILLATSIIESGIDIPSVNTLIVDEAEEFGLAQLYQLRGRVGRERQKAFCYLLYSPGVPLTQDARARLEALREFTELGSGYRLAMRDMEIRGAGNLLGQQQHGFIAAVGLDLYSQLLQEEISRMKGEPPPAEPARFPSMDLIVHAYLPQEYLPSDEMRILFYKKLVSAESEDALQTVRSELEDRFGPMPSEGEILFRVSRMRIQARDLGISGVVEKASSVDIQFLANTPLEPVSLLQLAHERSHVRFRPGPPFTLTIDKDGYASTGALSYLESLFRWLFKELRHATKS